MIILTQPLIEKIDPVDKRKGITCYLDLFTSFNFLCIEHKTHSLILKLACLGTRYLYGHARERYTAEDDCRR